VTWKSADKGGEGRFRADRTVEKSRAHQPKKKKKETTQREGEAVWPWGRGKARHEKSAPAWVPGGTAKVEGGNQPSERPTWEQHETPESIPGQ